MIDDKILNIVSRSSGIDIDEIDLESELEDLGLDSLDLAEMNAEIEEETGIMIPDADWNNLDTVQDLIEYVKDKT